MSYTIGACGFSGTGSSAICDYLKEFDENSVLNSIEFYLPYIMDGLQDLRYHLHEGGMRDFNCRLALKRYENLCNGYEGKSFQQVTNGKFRKLSNDYCESIIQIKLAGRYRNQDWFRSVVDRAYRKLKIYKVLAYFEKKLDKEICIYPLRKVGISIYPDNFEEKTKKYVRDILDAMGRDETKNTVLDQPFSGNDPAAAFSFFDNPKAIVVDRDPRDIYVLMKDFWRPSGFRAIPADNPRDYCLFHRKLRENMPYKRPNPDILCIQFEDMVYQYEETTKRIKAFCGLENAQSKRKSFFPEKSINNTQVFKRYPQWGEDIRYIERELPEYLYPFEKYKGIDTSGEMFY